jgi:hypothetical protein
MLALVARLLTRYRRLYRRLYRHCPAIGTGVKKVVMGRYGITESRGYEGSYSRDRD